MYVQYIYIYLYGSHHTFVVYCDYNLPKCWTKYGYMSSKSYLMNTSDFAVLVLRNYSIRQEIVGKCARLPSDDLSIHLPFSTALCVISWQPQINVTSHSNRPHFFNPTDTIRFVLLFTEQAK